MSLFQKTVLNKYLESLDVKNVDKAWIKFKEHFHNPLVQENIRESKEEQYQGEFLIDLFVKVLGYVKNPQPDFNLTTELKNISDSKKTDGAILKDGNALAVIELKGTNTIDLSKVENQAFGYKNNHPDCRYVIISNFEKLRLYIDNAIDYEEFNLFKIDRDRFNQLWLCLSAENLLKNIPKKIKYESLDQEEVVTKKLYKDYSQFRSAIFKNITKSNIHLDKVLLFKKTQKLLDRFLFIFFAEDKLLLPPNSIRNIIKKWKKLEALDAYEPLYSRFKKFFGYLNLGHKDSVREIFAYNGGLFKPDKVLDSLEIDDMILYEHTLKLSHYDFDSEVDVNILGHIFEHSLTEIENLQAELEGKIVDKSKTKRKKDGVFYTPKYITKYIVENTLGKLCDEKKQALELEDAEYEKPKKGRKKDTLKVLDEKLIVYRNWLLQLTICDPACGSGAFLNESLSYLMKEHSYIDELKSKLFDDAFVYSGIENSILENNLYGVDINEESVEIAKLSLWLRTAQKGRKLTSLNNNIKCGNSLIKDSKIAGKKAFDWKKEFPEVFENGGFDVIIGNPPYLRIQGLIDAYPKLVDFYEKNYTVATGNYDIYVLFLERCYELINKQGEVSLILPHKFLISEFGQGVRNFLATKKAVSSILHFEEYLVFDVTTYTCIINLNKKSKKYLMFKHINPMDIALFFKWDSLEQNSLGQDNWNLISLEKQRLFDKLNSSGLYVKDVFSKVFVGIQSSADSIYLIEGKQIGDYIIGYSKSLDGEVKIERDFVKPLLKGKDVARYATLQNKYFVLFPYRLSEEDKAEPMKEGYIEEHFPMAYKYLKDNEVALRGREKGRFDNLNWFLFGRQQGISEVQQSKIITPEISLGCNMTFDAGQMYHNTTTYSFILKNPSEDSYLYYLAILNSNVLWFFLANTGTVLRGGYFRFKTKYLYPFPLPKEQEDKKVLVDLVKRILELKKEVDKSDRKFLQFLCAKYDFEKLNKKLLNWHQLESNSFLSELKKSKVFLTLKDESEWVEYFNESKLNILELKSNFNNLSQTINIEVYKLYDLTEDEIKLLEVF